jgi:hypothetical protein
MNREMDEEVRLFVGIATMCRRFSCLPGPGGLFEQDGYIMMGVGLAMDALNEKEERDQAKKNVEMQNKVKGHKK